MSSNSFAVSEHELLRINRQRKAGEVGEFVPPSKDRSTPPAIISPQHSAAEYTVNNSSFTGNNSSFVDNNSSFTAGGAGAGGGGRVSRTNSVGSAGAPTGARLIGLLAKHQVEHNKRILGAEVPTDLCLDKRELYPTTRQHREAVRKVDKVKQDAVLVQSVASLDTHDDPASPTASASGRSPPEKKVIKPWVCDLLAESSAPQKAAVPLQCELCTKDRLVERQPKGQDYVFWCFDCFPGQLQCSSCCHRFHTEVCAGFMEKHRICVVTSSDIEEAKQADLFVQLSPVKLSLNTSRVAAADYVSRVSDVQKFVTQLHEDQRHLPPPGSAASPATLVGKELITVSLMAKLVEQRDAEKGETDELGNS